MERQTVLTKAKNLGFSSQLNPEGFWEIQPLQSNERWLLIQNENRWILSVNNVPQLYLITSEVLSFLNNRDRVTNKILKVIQ